MVVAGLIAGIWYEVKMNKISLHTMLTTDGLVLERFEISV